MMFLNIGEDAAVVDDIASGHQFEIGTLVKVEDFHYNDLDGESYLCSDGRATWWVDAEELEKVK